MARRLRFQIVTSLTSWVVAYTMALLGWMLGAKLHTVTCFCLALALGCMDVEGVLYSSMDAKLPWRCWLVRGKRGDRGDISCNAYPQHIIMTVSVPSETRSDDKKDV